MKAYAALQLFSSFTDINIICKKRLNAANISLSLTITSCLCFGDQQLDGPGRPFRGGGAAQLR